MFAGFFYYGEIHLPLKSKYARSIPLQYKSQKTNNI